MPVSNRRIFMLQAAAGSTALMAGSAVQAQPALVSEKDAQAAALGYVADTSKADAKKYPKHAASQMCSNCQVYAGTRSQGKGRRAARHSATDSAALRSARTGSTLRPHRRACGPGRARGVPSQAPARRRRGAPCLLVPLPEVIERCLSVQHPGSASGRRPIPGVLGVRLPDADVSKVVPSIDTPYRNGIWATFAAIYALLKKTQGSGSVAVLSDRDRQRTPRMQ